ncbi:MAG: LysR family transcriptional regulator, partial [Actinomycetota bacterium]|nr:LysR family transcriptional regulator [Actinomycetota bacterium]
MELRHLQALIAVSEWHSFSAAADAMGTVQSNVSAHVARLERELGVTLIERSGGRLTSEGEVVVSRAYRIFGELDALAADVSALRQELAGTVRAGIIGTVARWVVTALLSDLSARHPKLRLVVSEGSTMVLEPALGAGRLDLALLSAPVPGREVSFEPLFEEDIVLVVAADDDRWAERRSIMVSELGDEPLLLPATGTPFRIEIDQALTQEQVALRPLAELDGVRLMASLVFEGFGPAILPASAVPTHLRDRFRSIPITGMPPRIVGLALRSRGLPSAPARAVIDATRRLGRGPGTLPMG